MNGTDLFVCLATATLLSLAGCGQENASDALTSAPDNDDLLRAIIDRQALIGDPGAVSDLPMIDDPVAQLGMQLFFTKALGGDTDVACVSCHHPLLGGGD